MIYFLSIALTSHACPFSNLSEAVFDLDTRYDLEPQLSAFWSKQVETRAHLLCLLACQRGIDRPTTRLLPVCVCVLGPTHTDTHRVAASKESVFSFPGLSLASWGWPNGRDLEVINR